MVTDALAIPLLVGVAALVLAAIAEHRHAQRVARVARLAFGPAGKPAAWTHAAPFARTVGLALAAFGATVLLRYDPVETDIEPEAPCRTGPHRVGQLEHEGAPSRFELEADALEAKRIGL